VREMFLVFVVKTIKIKTFFTPRNESVIESNDLEFAKREN
jgi:hypothetical protein